MLHELGFVFDGKEAQYVREQFEMESRKQDTEEEERWEEQFMMLSHFTKENGHCVPRRLPRDSGFLYKSRTCLRRFADQQRSDFKV